MSSIAFLGCNYAFAQTATHADNIIALDALSIGDLPTDIATVVTNLEGYLAFEEGNKTLLENSVTAAEGTVTTAENTLSGLQTDAANKQTEIQNLILGDPLDPQIAIEQANLAVIQANIITANATVATAEANVATAEANVANSETKIALYNSALAPTGPVVTAQDAAAAAADDINQAVLDYTTPNSSAGGLEGVIAEIENVAAGDQAAVTTAITNADTAFQLIGAENASVADIQALVGAIDTNLPNLPPISAADQTTAVQTVTDGAYERVAIADNAGDIATNTGDIATLNGDDTVDGSVDSKVAANSTADQDYADAQDALNSTADQAYADAQDALNSTADQDYTDQEVTALENGAVATNTADINTLNETVFSADLEDGEVGIAGTITKKANGEIHIGENSLITAEVGGEQLLYATDALGDAIDINVTNGSNLLINGDSVATQLYADQAEADANAYTDAREAAITSAYQAADANLQSQISKNREDIDANTRGIAMVAALQHTTVLPGMTHALDISGAHFEGETGMALNYARRINENVQINFGAASTTDFDESVIKAGVGIQW